MDAQEKQPNRPIDEFFRPKFDDESSDEYARAWMAAINIRIRGGLAEGQANPGERIEWSQMHLMAKDLRPGMMIADGNENETWVRVHSVKLVEGEPRARIEVAMRGVAMPARFAPSSSLWVLVPASVRK
jgi:hypothetical protein